MHGSYCLLMKKIYNFQLPFPSCAENLSWFVKVCLRGTVFKTTNVIKIWLRRSTLCTLCRVYSADLRNLILFRLLNNCQYKCIATVRIQTFYAHTIENEKNKCCPTILLPVSVDMPVWGLLHADIELIFSVWLRFNELHIKFYCTSIIDRYCTVCFNPSGSTLWVK